MTIRSHFNWIIIFLATIFLTGLSGPVSAESSEDQVATVNGKGVSRKAYEREIELLKARAASQGRPLAEPQLSMIKVQILDNMINQELLYQESKKSGIVIGADAVESHLGTIKNRFENEAAFQQAIEKMQVTEEEIKFQIRRGMAIQELVQTQVVEKIDISDADMKQYFDAHPEEFKQAEQVKASHILVKVTPDAEAAQKEQALKKIQDVREKIEKGEDFSSLAQEYSEGPSASRGGDLGYFSRGQMVKPFEDAAFDLKTDQVSDVVETRFGYHLIKVTERKAEKMPSYKEVKEDLNERLKQERTQQEVDAYIKGLRENAEIKKHI
jgi:peptidyl-prolyl cis-trans isomerase C